MSCASHLLHELPIPRRGTALAPALETVEEPDALSLPAGVQEEERIVPLGRKD
jgi:hypothetical protein